MSDSSVSGEAWQPSASPETLAARARLVARIRRFFDERGLLEVETPALSAAAVTDPHIESLCVGEPVTGAQVGYLHTSPEFPMKRLLAAGAGSIYQICRVFRPGELGRHHNPEFTMLEWYRPGFDHHRLMKEVAELVAAVAPSGRQAEFLSYAQAFDAAFEVDPHTASLEELGDCVRRFVPGFAADAVADRDEALDLLMSHVVAPGLGKDRATFLYDFPESQAALARVRPGAPPVAERFELFLDGMEIANGFHELTDAAEQRRRFEQDLQRRLARGQGAVPMDENLLTALGAGMPACAGVALGVDRLVMVALGAERIQDVMAFPFDRA